ncbi:MAG: ribonuclease III [Gammaproteobacteria bacterium]
MNKNTEQLERHIGYTFRHVTLLMTALSHRSVGKINNERLEFLGDAILNFVIAEALFERFPKAREGDLSRIRATLVKGETLAKIAKEFDLGEFLLLGSGELKSGGHRRPSILAGATEALIGAMHLDSDFQTCKSRILSWYESRLNEVSLDQAYIDPKTQLQEYLQSKRFSLPNYSVVETKGKAHAQTFVVNCEIEDLKLEVKGEGSSRRRAEQAAAQKMLEMIQDD